MPQRVSLCGCVKLTTKWNEEPVRLVSLRTFIATIKTHLKDNNRCVFDYLSDVVMVNIHTQIWRGINNGTHT